MFKNIWTVKVSCLFLPSFIFFLFFLEKFRFFCWEGRWGNFRLKKKLPAEYLRFRIFRMVIHPGKHDTPHTHTYKQAYKYINTYTTVRNFEVSPEISMGWTWHKSATFPSPKWKSALGVRKKRLESIMKHTLRNFGNECRKLSLQ